MSVEAWLMPAFPVVAHWETSAEIDSPAGGATANNPTSVHLLSFAAKAGHRYLARVSTSTFLSGSIGSKHILGSDATVLSSKQFKVQRGGGSTNWLLSVPLAMSGIVTATADQQINIEWVFVPEAIWKDWITHRHRTTFSIVDLGAS